MRGSHTSEAIAGEVHQVLLDTDIKRQLLGITCDNASNNSTLVAELEGLLEESGIIWNAKENTIPCVAHIINLVVQDIIKHLKLAASEQMENGYRLERRHIAEIQVQTSVPNSLRKVYTHLSHSLITD
jgi:hypothetical protein